MKLRYLLAGFVLALFTAQATNPGNPVSRAGAKSPPGGLTTQLQYNNAGVFGGMSNLVTTDGVVPTFGDDAGVVVAPVRGSKLYARFRANHELLTQLNPNGVEFGFAKGIPYSGIILSWTPQSGANLNSLGPLPQMSGSASTPAQTAGSIWGQTFRIQFKTGAAVNQQAAARTGIGNFYMGNSAGLGGFYMNFRATGTLIGYTTGWFIGVAFQTALFSGVTIQDQPNIAGFGGIPGDVNWGFWSGNTTGFPNAHTDTGFPVGNQTGCVEGEMYAAPNSSTIDWFITNVATGATAQGQVTGTDTPAVNTMLAPVIWIHNGGDGGGFTQLEVSHFYMETDY